MTTPVACQYVVLGWYDPHAYSPNVVSINTLRKYNEQGLLSAACATRSDICSHQYFSKMYDQQGSAVPAGDGSGLTNRFKPCTTIWPTSCLPTSHVQIFQGRFRFSNCRLITRDSNTKTPTIGCQLERCPTTES
jgi:hypothetical protein